jgi:hypothetical protein
MRDCAWPFPFRGMVALCACMYVLPVVRAGRKGYDHGGLCVCQQQTMLHAKHVMNGIF